MPGATSRNLWDFWAGRYDRLWAQRYTLGPSRRLVHAHLDATLPRTSRILDIGCGIGQLAQELALCRSDSRVMAVDTSEAMIDRARRENPAPNLEYFQTDLHGVPRGEGFDVIVMTHAFPYLDDKPAALRQMYALLRPAGHLLLVQANHNDAYDLAWLLAVKLTTTPAIYPSTRQLHAMMEEAGFRKGAVRSIEKLFFIPSVNLVEGLK